MWWRKEDDLTIDIQPRGEEDRHITSAECACLPRIGRSSDKRVMVVHRTFLGMRGFVPVADETEEYRGRMAA